MKNVRMGTVCRVCSGLRHCEHIFTIYDDKYVRVYIYIYTRMLFWKDVVALKMMVKGKGGILIVLYLHV